MSISISFLNNRFFLDSLLLPSRYYYFKEFENYIKLLTIGEGIFPKEKIKTKLKLVNSTLILANESATKVYSSTQCFATNYYNVRLQGSNFEFLNDELILFKNAKFIQIMKIRYDKDSTFFYSDLMSSGRSFENFDFECFYSKNSFYHDNRLEYIETYKMNGEEIKNYIERSLQEKKLFGKIYIRTQENLQFEEILKKNNIQSFLYSQNKEIMMIIILGEKLSDIKVQIEKVWLLYRQMLGKRKFILGKQ